MGGAFSGSDTTTGEDGISIVAHDNESQVVLTFFLQGGHTQHTTLISPYIHPRVCVSLTHTGLFYGGTKPCKVQAPVFLVNAHVNTYFYLFGETHEVRTPRVEPSHPSDSSVLGRPYFLVCLTPLQSPGQVVEAEACRGH